MKDNKLTNKTSLIKRKLGPLTETTRNWSTDRGEKNTLKKRILDTSWCVMVAKTEYLTIEYSTRREMMTNHYVKEEEHESP